MFLLKKFFFTTPETVSMKSVLLILDMVHLYIIHYIHYILGKYYTSLDQHTNKATCPFPVTSQFCVR